MFWRNNVLDGSCVRGPRPHARLGLTLRNPYACCGCTVPFPDTIQYSGNESPRVAVALCGIHSSNYSALVSFRNLAVLPMHKVGPAGEPMRPPRWLNLRTFGCIFKPECHI